MTSAALSMRWWLALTFSGIAALTALAVAQLFNATSEAAIRERARDLAAGTAVTAAVEIAAATTVSEIETSAAELGVRREMALFVFDEDGLLLTDERARGILVSELPNYAELRETALEGRRSVDTISDGRLITVALPLRGERAAALIAVVPRPDLEDALGIVREEIVRAALWAVAIGAIAGLGVAMLITRRLRRIAAAAAEIEQGRFDTELTPRFRDELGVLAGTIDSMRARLHDSFETLASERDRLNRLLEQLQEGVIAVDTDLNVEFANSQARELVGAELPPGRPLPDPWPHFSLRDAVRSVLRPGRTARAFRVTPGPAAAYVVAVLPPTPFSDAGVVVITDVTEAERRERAEREFVTNAAHELRTPLTAISSAVEALQLGAKDRPADRDRFLDVVERQTDRLTSLVRALLTLARAQTRSEPIRLEPVALEPLAREIQRASNNGSIAVDLCCDDVAVLAHRDLLHQALENLASNAHKHGSGDTVTLRVAHVGDRRVRIDVVDEGRGMPPQEAERALDRFYRAPSEDSEGFGLGLSIVKEVVSVMEGELSIDSRPGVGTTVSIVLEAAGQRSGCS